MNTPATSSLRKLVIDGTEVSDDTDAYFIAEIGHNHMGDVEQCKELFLAAKYAGVNAVKLQKRDNRALFTRAMFDQPYNSENAYAPTYGEHREYLEFGRDEYVELQKFAKEHGLTFFSTAFDMPSADFLRDLDMPAYKIASADLRNTPLLKHVASFGKPMVISTGGGTMEDIVRAHETVSPINKQFCLLQCTASYPCKPENLNLKVIETLRERFPETVVGFSSHFNGISMPLVSYMLGARVIEAHFTLNRANKGTDHAFSLEPSGLRRLVRDLQRAREAMGDGVKRQLAEEENPMKKMAKKLVAARDLPKGHVLTADDITFKAPGDGLPPYHVDEFLGHELIIEMREDEGFSWDHIAGGVVA